VGKKGLGPLLTTGGRSKAKAVHQWRNVVEGVARLGESIVPYTLATRGEDCRTREGVGGYTDCCEGNRVKTWERRSYRSGRRERGEQAVTSAGGKKGYEPAH
jgi:hypothetical protein